MRIPDGDEPLDASAVHPEAYPIVRRILDGTGKGIRSLIGDTETLRRLDAAQFTDERFGLPTVRDILRELEKPGRDPRPEFRAPEFLDGVETLKDLESGMVLQGTVTNVTNFGAFVDIGVHQDGLVHISAMADRFVKDPHQIVKTGDLVRVKIMDVDLERKRIALTMRLGERAQARSHGNGEAGRRAGAKLRADKRRDQPAAQGAMAAAFSKARGTRGRGA
jgi:uncharacterized protein